MNLEGLIFLIDRTITSVWIVSQLAAIRHCSLRYLSLWFLITSTNYRFQVSSRIRAYSTRDIRMARPLLQFVICRFQSVDVAISLRKGKIWFVPSTSMERLGSCVCSSSDPLSKGSSTTRLDELEIPCLQFARNESVKRYAKLIIMISLVLFNSWIHILTRTSTTPVLHLPHLHLGTELTSIRVWPWSFERFIRIFK